MNFELEKLQEEFNNKMKNASLFKKLFHWTGALSLVSSLTLLGAIYFAPKIDLIKRYESGKMLTEIIENRDNYLGESQTRMQFYNAQNSLEYDLENLRASNFFINESEERADYLRRLRAGFYSFFSITALSSAGAFFSELRANHYKRRFGELEK